MAKSGAGSSSSGGTDSISPIQKSRRFSRFANIPCWQTATAASLIGVGFMMLFGGLVTHTIVVPSIVESSVNENSRLVEGSVLWEKWAHPQYRIKFNLWTYSMKNPDEFMNGAIPEVSPSGPYVFDKKMENRVISASNGIVKYKRYNTYNFNEKDSCQTCILGNRIWVPNMIYQKFVEAASTPGMRAAATTLLSQTAFLEVEVDELLFEGYKDPFLDKVCEIPFMNFVCESILDVPDRIGLFFEANNTGSKVFEINDGTKNPEDLGKISTFDGSDELDEGWWATDESRKIRGTDGSLFKPFIKKSDKLYVFVIELCRSIWLEYQEEVEYRGLRAYRFIMPASVLDPSYAGNEGFCNPTEKKFFDSQNGTDCWPKGLLDISKCQRSAPPIMISMPNFLFASDEVKQSVKGMNVSDESRDSIVVDIEPRVGAVLHARRVSQVNIEMWNGNNLTFPINLKKMRSSLIPVLVVNEEVDIDDDSLEQIRSQLYDAEWYAYASSDTMMIVGSIILLLGVAFLAYACGAFAPVCGKRRDKLTPDLPPYRPKTDGANGYHNQNLGPYM